MKSFRDLSPRVVLKVAGTGLAVVLAGWAISASGALPYWMRNIEAGTEIENAFFRLMALPEGNVLFRRPPSETRDALAGLIQKKPQDAELYSLRALEDEQQLDFTAAEKDWKAYAQFAANKTSGQLALADFYYRRLRPQDEIAALTVVARMSADASESFTPAAEQRSWTAFERIFGIIGAQGLPKDVSLATYRAWIARYPKEQQLYSRFLEYLIAQKEFSAATQLLADYQKQFPGDDIFQVKAKALIEYRQGSIKQGLAVYDKSFQPLWDPELVKSYFDLLGQTQNLRKFLEESKAALNANPEDLNATARVFYYYQQQGKLDTAQQAITNLRLHKEVSKSAWTPNELFVCARFMEEIHAYPEAARYYFALYNSKGAIDSQEGALSGLANLLLTAPEAPIRLGSGELSLYKDIATMDQGPGYLNGILSLILNTTGPASEYSQEEQRAVSYFHRSRAADLLAVLDKNFPESASRPELHAKLLEFYASTGKSEAVLKGGKEFLAAFPKASGRTSVALLMADADARLKKTQEEFAIYDSILQELGAKADRVPLGARVAGSEALPRRNEAASLRNRNDRANEGEADESADSSETGITPQAEQSAAFQVKPVAGTIESGPRSPEYSRVLERYLARLVQLNEVPQALGVLRREIDHNPDDSGLYERLAVFLEQNKLATEQEEVYRRAIARFPDRSWYNKLARYYLRYLKNAEYEKLTRDAVKQFDGSDLESYFQSVGWGGTPQMYLRLNQYANARFPHNLYFVKNLLQAYHSKPTYDQAAWEALIAQHWFEEDSLRNEYFTFLSYSGRLEKQLQVLQETAPREEKSEWQEFVRKNPAAGQYLAEAEIWRSHYEQSAAVLKALAEEYPAAVEIDRTASTVYRSLAYFDPAKTAVAVKIEENLLAANPGDPEILARIGDIYSDREQFAQAAPYWERIPKVSPGESGGYLEAATIYWDYFDFENALRLLEAGRKELNNAALYGYEEGAIYESMREYPSAIREYAKAALSANGQSQAMNRLLELARRPKFADLVDQETQKLAMDLPPSMTAIDLRVRVLEAEKRKPELIQFLNASVNQSTTIEQAAAIETLAQQQSLEDVRQRALEKQAALASDPVTRMQLRYALVRLYEGRKEFGSAQRNIETLYKENPKLLGVVRATVDFYWKMKLYSQALAVLEQASRDAYPELGKQFSFEAARKSTEARQFEQARNLLNGLLKDSPYDSQYLAAMADTYAQEGDQAGLKQFYLEKIVLFRTAPLSAEDRKTRIATLRRGLIPALTRLKDYPGGVDQYIELVNAYPEDEALVSEAAVYAARYKRQSQLLEFYQKTVQQSPRDYRWPMVLAQVQTSLENYPAAIAAYGAAITIRPDRIDLRIARAALAERLMQFDDAVSDYERVYQLSYKDAKWMEKIAEVRARQGRNDDALRALKTALIDVGPERAQSYFEVARGLEGWGILEQAREFAEQGVHLAGNEFLASTEYHDDAKLYVRIMTRLRQYEKAYATLQQGLSAANATLPVAKEQIAKEGIAAITDKEWREQRRKSRIANARNGLHEAMSEMGTAVARYFTPEEKASFVAFAEPMRAPMNFQDANLFAFSLVQSAGLAEQEARWRYDVMMNSQQESGVLLAQMSRFVELQRERERFAELGPQLERFAPRLGGNEGTNVLRNAADAYRAGGDSQNELRILSILPMDYIGTDYQDRYLALLLKQRPEQLVKEASAWTPLGEKAADFSVANGGAALAHAVVMGRASPRKPVWGTFYNGLVELYFAEFTPAVNQAFLAALGDQSIGERLGKPVSRDRQLAGDIWFYDGSRYGEYLADTKQGDAEAYLPASLEQSPASASSYMTLADYYAEKGDTKSSIPNYNHVLELAPGRADIHDRLALAYYKEGKRAEAVAEWKLFFSRLQKQIDSRSVPESFWADFGRACDHLQTPHLFAEVRPEVDSLVRAYLRRNGNYRSNALLHSAYAAQANPETATQWLMDVSSSAPDQATVISDVVDAPWIPLSQRGPLYQNILAAQQLAVDKSEGYQKESAQSDLRSWRIRWIHYLVEVRQFNQASEYIAALPKETLAAESAAIVPLELQIAAQQNTLDQKLAGYHADPQTAPGAEALRGAARQLVDLGDKQSARKILEFVFARDIDEHRLIASNFLGLAEVRLADADTAGAVELLRRLVIVAGDPYQNMDSAAALLEKAGHAREAIEFLEPLAKATPWEPGFRMRLAEAQIAAAQDSSSAHESLVKIAASPQVAYAVRVKAALTLSSPHRPAELGSAELVLLAGETKSITANAADQPFFYDARMKAALNSPEIQVKIQLLSKALGDTPAREDARIPLFQSAITSHTDEFALSSIERMLRDQRIRRIAPERMASDDDIIASEDDDAEDETDSSIYTPTTLQPAQHAQLARAVAEALMRLNRYDEALPYLQVAAKLEKTPARRKEIAANITIVRARLRRERLNLARRPILHEALEQDRLVRPKLLPRTALAANPSMKGEVQP